MLNGSKQNRKELSKQEIHREKAAKDFCKKMLKKNISLQKIFPKMCPLQFQLHFKTHTCSEGDTIKNFIQQKNWENNLL